MFDWQGKIKELGKYNISFEIKQGYYHVALVYNKDWEILESENQSIYIEKRHDICHYIAQIETVDVADIFKCIDETIKYNEDLQKKIELFKQKTNELQEIFAKEDYKKLLTLDFSFKESKEKKKIVRSKKKEQNTKETKKQNKKKIEESKEEIKNVDVSNNIQTDENVILKETDNTTINECLKI